MTENTRYTIHKGLFIFLILLFFAQFLLIVTLGHAAPPEGKGNEKAQANSADNNGKAVGQEKENPSQSNPSADNRAEAQSNPSETRSNRSEAQENRSEQSNQVQGNSSPASERSESSSKGNSVETTVDLQHPHQERQNLDISDHGNSSAKGDNDKLHLAQAAVSHGAFGQSLDHAVKGHEAAKLHVEELLKSLNKLDKGRFDEKVHGKENAKWDQNPKDTRGQGNMGKVDMRSPYGFDKESGREGSERGRPIRETEPVLDLSTLVTIDFMSTDYYLQALLKGLTYFQTMASRYPNNTIYSYLASYYEQFIARYTSLSYHMVAVNSWGMLVDYTFNLGDVPESFEGKTLAVTTTLTSINQYDSYILNIYSPTLESTPLHYDAGQVLVSQTQEVTLTDGGTFTYTYDPPESLVGWTGGYFELAVTVTEPTSGATYTLTYDKDIYLYRCPYGIIYDKKTGKAVVGATVTVHNEDGSIAALDKASNPNVSNPQTTDVTGRYNCKLAIGKKYYLTVKAPGYEEYKSQLFSERWHIVREDVGMTQLPLIARK